MLTALRKIPVFLTLAGAALYGDGVVHHVERYSATYTYDASGRITHVKLDSPMDDSVWLVDYSYAVNLAEAVVRLQNGTIIRRFKYDRDPSGKLIKKHVLSASGVGLGVFELYYDGSKISKIVANAPAELPYWDALVDK